MSDRTTVLLEEIRDQNNILIEGQSALKSQLDKFAQQEDLLEVKRDVRVVKIAVRATNKDLQSFGKRVKRLETTV